MRKILILTMCCNQPLFILQELNLRDYLYAKDILDGKFENVNYLTYTASTDGKYHYNKKQHKLEVPADDTLNGTYEKTYKAFKLIKQLNIEYDYILRTNCSTYINVQALKNFINSLSENDYHIYSGSIYCTPNHCGPFEWCLYGVGNSLLLSKDWVNIIVGNHVSKLLSCNNVKDSKDDIYTIDDNTIGFVVNSFLLINKRDMYEVWLSFNIPPVNHIPKDPYNYIAIPFREYNKEKTRNKEEESSKYIHKLISEYDVNNIPVSTYNNIPMMHIIDFDRHMHSIMTRSFGEAFLDVMSIPRYLEKIQKQLNK